MPPASLPGREARVFEVGKRQACQLATRVDRSDGDHFLRPLNRQAADADCVDDGEERGVDTDADGERTGRGERKRPLPAEQPDGEPYVVPKRIDGRQHALVAIDLLDRFDPAEGAPGSGGCRIRRESSANVVVSEQIEVSLDLLVKLAVLLPASEQAGHTRQRTIVFLR